MSGSSGLATSAEAIALVDTSVAVAIILADHENHRETVAAVHGHRLGLAGHAWFETYSVLTRLPPGARRSPRMVRSILEQGFPETRYLPLDESTALAVFLPGAGVAGGAVYDALVGAAAHAAGLPLFSRDRRARPVYESLGVDLRLIE
jgi:predicted nucleic acid-binding protein